MTHQWARTAEYLPVIFASSLQMGNRRPLAANGILCLMVAAAVTCCFFQFGAVGLSGIGIGAATGLTAAGLWWAGGFLPGRFSPTAGVTSLLASFVPAAFIPDAFFMGLGLLFIVACTLAGGVFSFVFGRIVDQRSR